MEAERGNSVCCFEGQLVDPASDSQKEAVWGSYG